jgi:hypothetical protein
LIFLPDAQPGGADVTDNPLRARVEFATIRERLIKIPRLPLRRRLLNEHRKQFERGSR